MSRDFRTSIQAVALGASRAAGQLAMVVVQAVVARSIGVERFGAFASAFALATVLSGLIDFGAGAFLARELSAGRMLPNEFARRSAGKIVAGTIVAAVLLVAGYLGFYPSFSIAGAGLLMGSIVSQTFQTALIASRENFRLSIFALVQRLAMVGAFSLLFAGTSLSPELAFVCAYLVDALVFAALTSLALPSLRPDYRHPSLGTVWKGAGYYGLSTSLISLQSTDVMIGAAVGGQSVAGAFGAVAKWTMPIALATQSFTTVLTPIAAAAKDRWGVWRAMKKLLWIPIGSLVSALVIVILAEPLIKVILGDAYRGSVVILRLLALSAALSSLSQVASTILQTRRRERIVARGLAVSVSLQLVLVAPLVHATGANGLALASVVGQGALVLLLTAKLVSVMRER